MIQIMMIKFLIILIVIKTVKNVHIINKFLERYVNIIKYKLFLIKKQ